MTRRALLYFAVFCITILISHCVAGEEEMTAPERAKVRWWAEQIEKQLK